MHPLLHIETQINRPLYQKGDRGQDVRLLQQYLAAIGFNPGAADGVFGDKTLAAVKNFQRSVGQQPDGYVWLATFEAIVQQYELRAPPNSPGRSTVTVSPQGQIQQVEQHDDGTQPFPRWALYVGLAAAGAVALYFLTRQTERRAMASYRDCDCDRQLEGNARLKFKKTRRRIAALPWRTS